MNQRRRGKALDDALLGAAWEELTATGYAGLTMEAVASRAQTSRAVLYRRWGDKNELVRATMAHVIAEKPLVAPDNGSLREDLLDLMQQLNRDFAMIVVALNVYLGEYFETTESTPAELREYITGVSPDFLHEMYVRAGERGEVDVERLTSRVETLPIVILREEIFVRVGPVEEEVLLDIVDSIVMPLLEARYR
jgi:AcrR family transcriptional regulator